MKDIAIYGAGGFGREVAQLIEHINSVSPQWNCMGFYDDGLSQGNVISSLEVLGGIDDANQSLRGMSIVIAIANSSVRRKIVAQLNKNHFEFPAIIHPATNVDTYRVRLGKGTIICAGNIFTTDIEVGDFGIVNLACTIGHDVKVGDYCSIMPGVHLSGNVHIGEGTLIGSGAFLLQNITIGKYAKIGAGAVVTKPVNDYTTVVGVPAKELKKR